MGVHYVILYTVYLKGFISIFKILNLFALIIWKPHILHPISRAPLNVKNLKHLFCFEESIKQH